jgi:hypothetical protein
MPRIGTVYVGLWAKTPEARRHAQPAPMSVPTVERHVPGGKRRRAPDSRRTWGPSPRDCWRSHSSRCSSAGRRDKRHTRLAEHDRAGRLEPRERDGILEGTGPVSQYRRGQHTAEPSLSRDYPLGIMTCRFQTAYDSCVTSILPCKGSGWSSSMALIDARAASSLMPWRARRSRHSARMRSASWRIFNRL